MADEKVFYTRDELQPKKAKNHDSNPPLLSESTFEKLNELVSRLSESGVTHLSKDTMENTPEVISFVETLRILGSVKIEKKNNEIILSSKSPFARNFNQMFLDCLKNNISIINNWHSNQTIEGKIIGKNFLLSGERERIEKSLESGITPTIFRQRPVSFAIIKRKDASGVDQYLFEMNKEWQEFNLPGGKQEQEDNNSYEATILRELEEEIGIGRGKIRVTALTKQPIHGFGLLGNYGLLTEYPAMFYQAFISTNLALGPRWKWFTLDEFKEGKGKNGEIFMVNPDYKNFLLNNVEGGLEKLPSSFVDHKGHMNSSGILEKINNVSKFVVKHKEIIVAIIIITGAVLGVLKGIFGIP